MFKHAMNASEFARPCVPCNLLAAVAILWLAGAAAADRWPDGALPPKSLPPNTAPLLKRLPPDWRDDRGGTLRLPELQGHRIFVTMAYTSCHRVCPLTLTRLAELQSELDARGIGADVLIVSYDPGNDDPAAWRRYRASHGLFRGNWHFLSGTPADTERLARALGFEMWRDGEHVMHDYRIVALDSDGAGRGIVDSAHADWQALL